MPNLVDRRPRFVYFDYTSKVRGLNYRTQADARKPFPDLAWGLRNSGLSHRSPPVATSLKSAAIECRSRDEREVYSVRGHVIVLGDGLATVG